MSSVSFEWLTSSKEMGTSSRVRGVEAARLVLPLGLGAVGGGVCLGLGATGGGSLWEMV